MLIYKANVVVVMPPQISKVLTYFPVRLRTPPNLSILNAFISTKTPLNSIS